MIRDCAHQYVGISRLTPDYLNTTGIINKIPDCEGMAMMRLANGTYYLITSHLTGWSPNPLIAWRSTTTNLATTNWTNLGNPTNDDHSFNSQPTYIVQYTPASGSPYFVYLGDDWFVWVRKMYPLGVMILAETNAGIGHVCQPQNPCFHATCNYIFRLVIAPYLPPLTAPLPPV